VRESGVGSSSATSASCLRGRTRTALGEVCPHGDSTLGLRQLLDWPRGTALSVGPVARGQEKHFLVQVGRAKKNQKATGGNRTRGDRGAMTLWGLHIA